MCKQKCKCCETDNKDYNDLKDKYNKALIRIKELEDELQEKIYELWGEDW